MPFAFLSALACRMQNLAVKKRQCFMKAVWSFPQMILTFINALAYLAVIIKNRARLNFKNKFMKQAFITKKFSGKPHINFSFVLLRNFFTSFMNAIVAAARRALIFIFWRM
jgi:hypothetical protein